MFLLDLFKKRAKGRTPYEWFEQMILGILVFIIAMIIIYTLILAIITLVNDFRSGITFMETAALQDTFGLILTVIILVEFNHSIVLAIRQRSGAIQVRIVVLITVIVLARKLVLRSNQMIHPLRYRPRQAAVLSRAIVNHLFDPEH